MFGKLFGNKTVMKVVKLVLFGVVPYAIDMVKDIIATKSGVGAAARAAGI